MPEYIIVQAGGRGSRMEGLTRNKPKALVPVNNLPIIFHLFRKYPDKKFIIIGDYQYERFENYLRAFAGADYQMVRATGHRGTCAGLGDALELVPEGEPFILIWCDLILPEGFILPDSGQNLIGLAKDFACRWRYHDNSFLEERSAEEGVAGFFVFREKSFLSDVPTDGEFVRWLRSKEYTFEVLELWKTHEYGDYRAWEELPRPRTRPFNTIRVKDGKLYKIPLDEQGRRLAVREEAWYRELKDRQLENLPKIYGFSPLCMENIDGRNIYEYTDISDEGKRIILQKIIHCIRKIHKLETVPADRESYRAAWLTKTYDRLKKVRTLAPFANDETVTVNGRVCRNIFFHRKETERLVMKYAPAKFSLIHGDCTFSNILLKRDGSPALIDPRGYFGHTELFGDAAYDWVKLYYSLVSNYDQFNLKRFHLYINESNEYTVYEDRGNEVEVAPGSVKLELASSRWEGLEEDFFALLGTEVTRRQMKVFLALTWLSLTAYAWEDWDSVCGAFYQGLFYLEEALSMKTEDERLTEEPPFESAYEKYFQKNRKYMIEALKSVRKDQMEGLLDACESALRRGNKIVASGLGKNVPICEKFVGTMLSLGFAANFMHTNNAVHGDLGMLQAGDLVILLSKSAATAESVYLAELLARRNGVIPWLFSFNEHSELAGTMQNKLIVRLGHEGDIWNVIPNNSTTVTLIILQELAIELSRRFSLSLEKDFKPNHPGGAIGEKLRREGGR